mgnify:CR=1 FL=1
MAAAPRSKARRLPRPRSVAYMKSVELPLAHLLSAMFDRAALAPADEINDYRKVMKALIRGLKK